MNRKTGNKPKLSRNFIVVQVSCEVNWNYFTERLTFAINKGHRHDQNAKQGLPESLGDPGFL